MRLHPHEFIRRFLMHVLPNASTASATTGSLPTPSEPRTSRRHANSSMSSPRLPLTRKSRQILRRMRLACCRVHAHAAAPA